MVCVHACLEMDVPYHVPLHTVAKVTKWALYRIITNQLAFLCPSFLDCSNFVSDIMCQIKETREGLGIHREMLT